MRTTVTAVRTRFWAGGAVRAPPNASPQAGSVCMMKSIAERRLLKLAPPRAAPTTCQLNKATDTDDETNNFTALRGATHSSYTAVLPVSDHLARQSGPTLQRKSYF